MARKLTCIAILLSLLVATVACRPRITVRLTTLVYHDGSLDRRVEIVGRTADGEVPTEDDWIEEDARIHLAQPDAWERVERGPGWLRAEGFFLNADELPALLAVQSGASAKTARMRTLVELDDRVVLKRWSYVERHGDPYSATESAAALEALVELAVEALSSELYDHFGSGVDPAPAERLLRDEGRSLAQALLTVNRSASGWEQTEDRVDRWTRVLQQHGVPARPPDDPDDYWDQQMLVILDWARERVADVVSTPETPIRPHDLSFWPSGDDYEERVSEIAIRVWGSEDELFAEVEPHLAALVGYYGGDDVPRFRFECRVQLPGTLFETNGTPDDESVVWLFRERDLTFGEIRLRAESVELQDAALVSLGARREFDALALVRLVDLLWKRDRHGALAEVLTRAVEEADLDLLRDENTVPEELILVAAELADLLDPSIPLE
jgi:hypothetical protein